MNISEHKVRQLTITGILGLDSVRVILEDVPTSPGNYAGHITVLCYGQAWTAYFGSMSSPLEQFVEKSSDLYLLGRFINVAQYRTKRERLNDEQYVTRIIHAVKAALKEVGAA